MQVPRDPVPVLEHGHAFGLVAVLGELQRDPAWLANVTSIPAAAGVERHRALVTTGCQDAAHVALLAQRDEDRGA